MRSATAKESRLGGYVHAGRTKAESGRRVSRGASDAHCGNLDSSANVTRPTRGSPYGSEHAPVHAAVIVSIVRLSQIKGWVWPAGLLAFGNLIFVVAGNTFHSPTLTGIRWGFLAAFFALTAAGLFSYLRNSRSVARAQLYTAVNIYLLLGLLWTALYLAIDAFSPGSIQIGSHPADRQAELLYFSLVTLSTIGYGDIVPVNGEARILAALEGITGVLYIAITVALLVGRFRSDSAD
jgi:Ion channel